MKGLTALAAAAFIALAGALWFATKPTIVAVKADHLKANADLAMFKRLER